MDDLIDSYGSLFDMNGDGELDSMEKSYGFDVMNDFLSDDPLFTDDNRSVGFVREIVLR